MCVHTKGCSHKLFVKQQFEAPEKCFSKSMKSASFLQQIHKEERTHNMSRNWVLVRRNNYFPYLIIIMSRNNYFPEDSVPSVHS